MIINNNYLKNINLSLLLISLLISKIKLIRMKGISVNTCCIILIVIIVILLIRAFTNEGKLWGEQEYLRYVYDINSIMNLMSDRKKVIELMNTLNGMTIEELRNLSNELKNKDATDVQNFLPNLPRYIQEREKNEHNQTYAKEVQNFLYNLNRYIQEREKNKQTDENIPEVNENIPEVNENIPEVNENSPPELIYNYLEYLIENEYDMRQIRNLTIPEITEKMNNLENIIKNNQTIFNVLGSTEKDRLQTKIEVYLSQYNNRINDIKEKEAVKKIIEDNINKQEKQQTYDNPFIEEEEEREKKYYENLTKEPEVQFVNYPERSINEPTNKKSYLMYIIGAIIIISVILYFILKKKK